MVVGRGGTHRLTRSTAALHRLAISCLLITAVVSGPGRQAPLGAQEADAVPPVLVALADLLPQDTGDPIVVEFLVTPTEAGSLADDPVADVKGGVEETGLGGPDLLRFSMFTLPAEHLTDGFSSLVASASRPAGIALYGQDPWVVPAPDSTLVAMVAEFDRALTVTREDACITQVNARRSGPTTPEAKLFTQDPRRDTNISYQLAGWESLPTYATEADTTTETFDTVVGESSLFGVVFENQAVLFIPQAQFDDVSAVRMSNRCAGPDPASGSSDQSDLVPFDPTSLAAAYFGPASSLPEPATTTTTTTAPTTTGDSTATDAGSDSTSTGGDEAQEALDANSRLTAADASSPRDLLGPWALIVGLAMAAAGGWMLYHTPPWGRPDGSSAEAGPE